MRNRSVLMSFFFAHFEIFTELNETHLKVVKSKCYGYKPVVFLRFSEAISTCLIVTSSYVHAKSKQF